MEHDKETVDNMRSDFARAYNISNMNELVYDPKLVKFANGLMSCEDLKNGYFYQFSFYTDEIKAAFEKFSKETNQEIASNKMSGSNHPQQTSFAVCNMNNVCDDTDDRSELRILGPRGTLRASAIKYGEPGSACPNGTTEKGLCKVPEDHEEIWPWPYYDDEDAEIEEFLESKMNATTVAEVETTENGVGLLSLFGVFLGVVVVIFFFFGNEI